MHANFFSNRESRKDKEKPVTLGTQVEETQEYLNVQEQMATKS